MSGKIPWQTRVYELLSPTNNQRARRLSCDASNTLDGMIEESGSDMRALLQAVWEQLERIPGEGRGLLYPSRESDGMPQLLHGLIYLDPETGDTFSLLREPFNTPRFRLVFEHGKYKVLERDKQVTPETLAVLQPWTDPDKIVGELEKLLSANPPA
jgi:hypothetical protein